MVSNGEARRALLSVCLWFSVVRCAGLHKNREGKEKSESEFVKENWKVSDQTLAGCLLTRFPREFVDSR